MARSGSLAEAHCLLDHALYDYWFVEVDFHFMVPFVLEVASFLAGAGVFSRFFGGVDSIRRSTSSSLGMCCCGLEGLFKAVPS
jgi:hypothetical protein